MDTALVATGACNRGVEGVAERDVPLTRPLPVRPMLEACGMPSSLLLTPVASERACCLLRGSWDAALLMAGNCADPPGLEDGQAGGTEFSCPWYGV